MDLILFYQKIREEENKIDEEFPVVVSKETGDGGKPGQCTEVPKHIAARLVVQGLARLAGTDEAEAFRGAQRAAVGRIEEQEAIAKVHLSVMPTLELEKLKSAVKSKG